MPVSLDLAYGDDVLVPFGFDSEVRGTVQEIYGPKGRRHVLVLLEPVSSDYVVAGPTTVSWPIELVRKVASAK